MTTYTPTFEPGAIDTPAGMAASVALGAFSGIPSTGTCLAGVVYAPGTSIRSLADLADILGTGDAPDLTFTASEVFYMAKSSHTSVAEFLGDDADSLSGDGTAIEMGPSGITLSGFIYIPPGAHAITVYADDGFALALGGVEFATADGVTNGTSVTRVADFDGGLYAVEMAYYDAHSSMALGLAVDGLPVDQSAFYQTTDDFTAPPADVPLVPLADYHPSYFLGEQSLDTPVDGTGTEGRDILTGNGADDILIGAGGDDELRGGYGNDQLLGGDGNDVLDGGRGSDLLDGGAGDDLLIARSDAGEQRIGQLAIGEPTRDDPDGEVDATRQKLTAYLDQPLIGDDILIGGEGRDTVLIAPQLNAKADIIAQHIKADGSIDWSGGGIAGENNELHDHWVDSFGIDIFADYNADEDQIAVIGHTATVHITYADVMGDAAEESIITVISNQGGGGGAHTQDLIGQLIVHGDRVEVGDVQTDAGVTYGIVDGVTDLPEALFPAGDTKMTEIDGQTVYGYDTRDAEGGLGAVTGDPASYFDNPFFSEDMLATPVHADTAELTRSTFEQLGTVVVAGEDNTAPGAPKAATDAGDHIAPNVSAVPSGLPGALAFWSLAAGADGAFDDARGGPDVRAYTLYENQALLRTDGATAGPDGTPGTALAFDDEDDFAYIHHDQAFEVSQGTIALWVRPDDIGGKEIFLSKDHNGVVDGGHFRLGHAEDGRLYLRAAPGDGSSNTAWISNDVVFTEGDWAHVAVSYTEDGVIAYIDGVAIPADGWTAVEGDQPSPNDFTGYFMLQNEEPWLLGADGHRTDRNDTAQEFGIDDEDLANAFTGALSDVGIWGGMDATDALTQAEVADLMANGPGAALTNPNGPEPMLAGDDVFVGGDGNDTIEGGAGDDHLMGEAGADTLLGGYGNDKLEGGSFNDILDGGRGSDLLIGGDGDDILISRSDVGEQRIGQLVLDDPSRDFPDPSVDPEYLKLVDWIDQPLVGDDVMIGGAGADHFLIETLINGKKDILIDNLLDDGRSIDWTMMGVAGENNRLHDHWVDAFGIDIIADFDASEDMISVIGHTTRVEVTHKAIDTTGDGFNNDMVSIITAYSQQGGGGAHDEDYLGYIVVHGDRVEEDMVNINPAVHYGIVDTIDELNEALAPTGETKWSTGPNGEAIFGYDTRDIDGDPIGSDPEAYSSNPWLLAGEIEFASAIPENVDPPTIVMTNAGASFDGSGTDTLAIDHTAGMAQDAGTWAFSFTADDPSGATWQALLSKDHDGYKDGGHLTVYLSPSGQLKVRIQTLTETIYLYGETVEAGVETHVAFSFDNEALTLFQNGELVAQADGIPDGMLGNTEDIVLGASSESRQGANDNLRYFFTGTLANLAVLDRPLADYEALFLSEGGGDLAALAAIYPGGLPLLEDPGDPGPNLVEGDELANRLHGYDDADLILGYAGDDRLYGYGDDDELQGGDGNDRGFGGDGDDLLRGDAGDDRLFGDAGNDEVDGGDGDDKLYGGTGEDDISGGAGADYLLGGDDNDIIKRGADDDTLKGEGGDDDLDGEDGNDRLIGGDGNDDLDGGDGDDKLYGDAGDDALSGGAGDDYIRGGADNDTAEGGDGDDRMYGDDGDDDLNGGDGLNRMYGGAGNDTMLGGADADVMRGGDGNDQAQGGGGDDNIAGGAGDDDLQGQAGNDRISGNEGDDQISGGDGDDRLNGNDGADTIAGEDGNDAVYGGAGEDLMTGGLGNDRLRGGDDNDTLRGDDGDDNLKGDGGDDDVEGGNGNDAMRGGDGNDDLDGGDGDDRLYGDAGDDQMTGGDGSDYLRGGDGNDTMLGGDGDDRMYGDAGDDDLNGGDGADRLVAGVS